MNKRNLARTTTDSNILHELTTDENSGVRYEVAHNYNTSPETLKVLSTDENSHVRNAVVQNKNCPLNVYKYIQGVEIIKKFNQF